MLRKENRIFQSPAEIPGRMDNARPKSNFTPVINKIQAKIPEKPQATLDTAFYMGFHLVFEKGNSLIEKIYNKNNIDVKYDLNNNALEKYMSKKHQKTLDKSSQHSKAINESIATIRQASYRQFSGLVVSGTQGNVSGPVKKSAKLRRFD